MKLSKILLTALVTLAFTTTANADGYKLKMCERAETSFWDAYKKAYAQEDHSFIEALGEENKRAYFNLHKSELIKQIEEVRNRCKTMDKDVQGAYDKKMSELDEELNKL